MAAMLPSPYEYVVACPAQEHVISAATHHSKIDSNVYEGMRIRGKVRQGWGVREKVRHGDEGGGDNSEEALVQRTVREGNSQRGRRVCSRKGLACLIETNDSNDEPSVMCQS